MMQRCRDIMRLFQKSCQPALVEGYRFDCQYFDRLNMTIKTFFETASFLFSIIKGHIFFTDSAHNNRLVTDCNFNVYE